MARAVSIAAPVVIRGALLAAMATLVASCGYDNGAAGGHVRVTARVVDVFHGCKVGVEMQDAGARLRGDLPEDFERSDTMACERAHTVALAAADRAARSFPVTQVIYTYVSPVDRTERRGIMEIERWYETADMRVMRSSGGLAWINDPPFWAAGTGFDPNDPHIGDRMQIWANPGRPQALRSFWA